MRTLRYTTHEGRTFKVEGGQDAVLAHLQAVDGGEEEVLPVPGRSKERVFDTSGGQPESAIALNEEPLVMPTMNFAKVKDEVARHTHSGEGKVKDTQDEEEALALCLCLA